MKRLLIPCLFILLFSCNNSDNETSQPVRDSLISFLKQEQDTLLQEQPQAVESNDAPLFNDTLNKYKNLISRDLKEWCNSFYNFSLSDFIASDETHFEDMPYKLIDSLPFFLARGKRKLFYSPDHSRFINIYTFEKTDRYSDEVKQPVTLCEPGTRQWRRILYLGPQARAQDIIWVDDDTFILAATAEYSPSPYIYIGHLDTRTFSQFYSKDPTCLQKKPYSPRVSNQKH